MAQKKSAGGASPEAKIIYPGPGGPFSKAQLRTELDALQARFVARRAQGLSGPAALVELEREITARADRDPVMAHLREIDFAARVRGSVELDGPDFVRAGQDPWNWSLEVWHAHVRTTLELRHEPLTRAEIRALRDTLSYEELHGKPYPR